MANVYLDVLGVDFVTLESQDLQLPSKINYLWNFRLSISSKFNKWGKLVDPTSTQQKTHHS